MKRILNKMWRSLIALVEMIIRRVQYKSRIEDKIDQVLTRQDDTERRVLRLEIISAIERNDRAVVHQLFDEYKSRGYNSYISEMYKDYCKKPTKRKRK